MICNPCKSGAHEQCPGNKKNWRVDPSQKNGTGLSPEGDAIQRSGLCPCQHRVNSDDRVIVAFEARVMKEITLEESAEKIRSGLHMKCGCGSKIVAGPEEPEGDAAEFVRLWFKDHSHEDLARHGLVVKETIEKMPKAAK